MKLTHDKTNTTVWSYSEVETALCLWEAVLSIYDEKGENGEKTPDAKLIESYWDGNGAYTMRAAAASMADECNRAFEAMVALCGGDYGDAFDWTWCPQFIRDSLSNGMFDQALEWQYMRDEEIKAKTWTFPLAA